MSKIGSSDSRTVSDSTFANSDTRQAFHLNSIIQGDALEVADRLADKLFSAIVTSPPYYHQRKYGLGPNELGREKKSAEYIKRLVNIFSRLRHSLRDDGTLWIVIGDKHINGTPCRVPSRLTDAMIIDGWHFVQEIIWYKNNIMASSYKNKFIIDHERILFFANNKKYYFEPQCEPYSLATLKEFGEIYNGRAVKDYKTAGTPDASKTKSNIIKNSLSPIRPKKMPPIGGVKRAGGCSSAYSGNTPDFTFGTGRLMRNTWQINTTQFHDAHFAVFPIRLVDRILQSSCPYEVCTICNKAKKPVYTDWKLGSGSKKKECEFTRDLTGYEARCNHETFQTGIVLDPFIGAGSTAIAAMMLGRDWSGIELNPDYIKMAEKRMKDPKYARNYYDRLQQKLPLA